ncbi:DUF4272 domain-containing protein [Brevibacillus borstelensis]|uniref:DUF4272 domain-containing protein n=1 Tax=Brevibacillus borstelensis TaxID=45462 RepID=UPI0004F339A2|nr:DUF4272 domain-containing protein [Brevibacillus borstelensis]KKX56577.1 hypothetical protein X546_04080 [Brevibacillus borstelensis cifa_chp40]
MQQCTLYVSIKERESVTDAIRKAFSEKTVEVSTDGRAVTVSSKKWFSKSTITFNTLREDLDPEAFDQMKRGMYGYFSQIETPHVRVQQKLLMQITALNVAVGIVSSDGIDKETFQKILEIARSVHGIVFLPTGEMLDKEGKLILDTAGESELEDFILTVSVDLIDGHIHPTPSGEAHKQRSMQLLREQGIPVIDHLPVIVGDEDAVIRTKDEIVQRAIALCLIAVYSGGIAENGNVEEEREFIEGIIEQYGAEGFFTEKERAFLYNDAPDRTDTIQMVWMYECYWVLLWALGYVETLDFPSDICDVQSAIDCLRLAENYDAFYQNATVRSKTEILDQADLIYRYDWACVDARINNRPVAGGLNDEVVLERHRALNWLVRYMDADWDDVQMDT